MSTTPGELQVQLFGSKKHPDFRRAERFFKERRIRLHLVDFAVRGPSAGELQRFVDRFGVAALLDRNSRRFGDLGLQTAHYGDARWQELLLAEPLLLVQPLARCGGQLAIGADEATWKRWVSR
jgi:arsenate reductase-like glutaredoxin family protein